MKIIPLIAALWGIIGITVSLGKAIYGMTPKVIAGLSMDLTVIQWCVLIAYTFFMLYYEGYRGFQQKYSPRTAARAKHLYDHPSLLRGILAPFFCMGYFYANRKTKLKAYILTVGIFFLIKLVSHCPQPWLGIVDFGVMIGLSWGLVAFWIFSYQALTQKDFPHSPETPDA